MQEIPLWYWLLVFFALGACVGSFYNVIVYRMPRGISLINPPSHCPLCKKHIPIRYNLPIVGWLWLRGKSACCKQPISVIYPIGEALCGLLANPLKTMMWISILLTSMEWRLCILHLA